MGSRQVWSAMRDSYHPCYHMMMKKKEGEKSKFEFELFFKRKKKVQFC